MKNDRGFTLLETLVGFMLLATVLGAAYAVFGGGLGVASRTSDATRAVIIAESAMARFGADLPLEPGTSRSVVSDHLVETSVVSTSVGTTAQRELRQTLYQISVRVSPPGRGAPVVLETLRLGSAE